MKEYRAVAYMRLSVAGSKETESESIENQESIINYFVGNHPDIKLVSRRIDDGYSGIVFDRPGFAAMMEDVKDGKIDCIIVKDLSRFGRDLLKQDVTCAGHCLLTAFALLPSLIKLTLTERLQRMISFCISKRQLTMSTAGRFQ